MAKKEDLMTKAKPELKRSFSKMGVWSFLIGLVIAVLAGAMAKQLSPSTYTNVVLVLAVLGFIVGILNVTSKEAIPFLVATIALVVSVSGMSVVMSGFSSDWINALVRVLDNIAIFVAPAALLVALKSIYVLASD